VVRKGLGGGRLRERVLQFKAAWPACSLRAPIVGGVHWADRHCHPPLQWDLQGNPPVQEDHWVLTQHFPATFPEGRAQSIPLAVQKEK
jgi:hypothetical protein